MRILRRVTAQLQSLMTSLHQTHQEPLDRPNLAGHDKVSAMNSMRTIAVHSQANSHISTLVTIFDECIDISRKMPSDLEQITVLCVVAQHLPTIKLVLSELGSHFQSGNCSLREEDGTSVIQLLGDCKDGARVLRNIFEIASSTDLDDQKTYHEHKDGRLAAHKLLQSLTETISAIQAHELVPVIRSLRSLQDFSFTHPVGMMVHKAPYLVHEWFIGRNSDLDHLQQVLQPTPAVSHHQGVILGGMAGVGKTQLALAYARRNNGKQYDSTLYLDATSKATLVASFRSLLEVIFSQKAPQGLDDDQTVAAMRKWLVDTRNTRWLLIIDNYNYPYDYKIRYYLPFHVHGSVILISQAPHEIGIYKTHILQPLATIHDGLCILKLRSGRSDALTDPAAGQLVQRVGLLPLALTTAGQFLSLSATSFDKWRLAYDQCWDLDARRPMKLHDYEHTLYTAWSQMKTSLEENDTETVEMLKLLAYFGNQYISYDLFQAGLDRESPQWLRNATRDVGYFDNLMRSLVIRSLVEIDGVGGEYRIHPCVHDWMLGGLNKTIDPRHYQYASACVAQRATRPPEWPQERRLHHASRLQRIRERYSIPEMVVE